jgi:hypothetical protein
MVSGVASLQETLVTHTSTHAYQHLVHWAESCYWPLSSDLVSALDSNKP